MLSKARFAGKDSKQGVKAPSGGSGSKKANQTTQGFGIKPGQIQVIYNGKIATPQSLLPRKTANTNYTTKRMTSRLAATDFDDQQTQQQQQSHSHSHSHQPIIGSLTAEEKDEKDNRNAVKKNNSQYSVKKNLAASAESENAMSRIRSSALNAAAAQKLAEQVVVVELSETDTEILLSLPSLVLSTELREAKDVEESNKAYEAIVEAHKNLDGFSSRPTQTVNNPQKNQNEMAAPNPSQETGCQAVAYDIADAMVGDKRQQTDEYSLLSSTESLEHDRDSGLSTHVAKFVADTVRMSLSTPGCLLDTLDVNLPNPNSNTHTSNTNVKSSGIGSNKSGKGNDHDITTNTPTTNKSKSKLGTSKLHEEKDPHDISNGSGPRNSSNGNNLSEAQTGEDGDVFDSDDIKGSGINVGFDYDSLKALEVANLESVLSSKTILKKLQMIERAVQQNAYHRQILEYRDFPDIKPLSLLCDNEKVSVIDSVDHLFGGGGGLSSIGRGTTPAGGIGGSSILDDISSVGAGLGNRKASHLVNPTTIPEEGPDQQSQLQEVVTHSKVKKLFSYDAPSLVRGRPVTCMSWNTENTDLLAVGYGKIDFVPDLSHTKGPNGEDLSEEELGSGLVLFWSLRNPDYPEKILRTPYAITSLDFSKRNPTLLAVGFYNGDIAVYDIRREHDWEKPMETSTGMSESHSDPVWQVKWLAKGQDRIETLISISTDGNVLQWSLKKGLLVSVLMQLKRGGAGEGWISRQASGLCFDFAPDDHGTYVTGTEEGSVHRCSVSYSEQYLETYEPHSGPVYRLKFSPWWGEVFLSCSADWTMSLYHMRSNKPLLNFHSSGEDFSINDICWCPRNSTVFAAVTADAKFQIWDISISEIDPIISLDTNLDIDPTKEGVEEKIASTPNQVGQITTASRKSTAASQNRKEYGIRNDSNNREDNDKETPVTRLLKSLGQKNPLRRTLTTVTFSENSPVAVVGDSKGVITVYRVNEPIIITDTSNPTVQTMKLKEAVWREADPADVAKLQTTHGITKSDGTNNNDKQTVNISNGTH